MVGGVALFFLMDICLPRNAAAIGLKPVSDLAVNSLNSSAATQLEKGGGGFPFTSVVMVPTQEEGTLHLFLSSEEIKDHMTQLLGKCPMPYALGYYEAYLSSLVDTVPIYINYLKVFWSRNCNEPHRKAPLITWLESHSLMVSWASSMTI